MSCWRTTRLTSSSLPASLSTSRREESALSLAIGVGRDRQQPPPGRVPGKATRMRQVVVLEPAGSVLVIRQSSLGNVGGNSTGTNDTHALVNHAAVPTIASNDHNQNRIVVVRSSTSSTCMTNSVRERDLTFITCIYTCIIDEPQLDLALVRKASPVYFLQVCCKTRILITVTKQLCETAGKPNPYI